MNTPRVTPYVGAVERVERDDFADDPARTPRRPPYRRPTQRELVRQALLAEGAYADYHGDRVTP
jgi:hypothetical protein